jgi:hypothetical protein
MKMLTLRTVDTTQRTDDRNTTNFNDRDDNTDF